MTALAPPAIEFTVLGQPRTKGSLRPIHRKRADGNCFVSLIEQGGFELAHWRSEVAKAASKAMKHEMPIAGPIRVFLQFYFPRPQSQQPAQRSCEYVWGNKRHDVDKLARLALDAMTDAAVWTDDSQVSELHAAKRYADDEHPIGVQVRVEAL